jgi:catechol 2,3-dioxygenase
VVGLPAGTRLGAVRLRVRSLERVAAFYRDTLGLREQARTPDGVVFAAADDAPLIRLDHAPRASRRPMHSTGLYHLALLFPSRAALGAAVRDVAAADHAFHGFADHLVSEAAYLADPEDNGIELYHDRPRTAWQHRGDTILMASELLDVPALLAEAELSEPVPGRTKELRIGHVHLHVASNERAVAFYSDVIGFDVTNRDYPGAVFLAADGYHHHIAVNEWAGTVAPPPDATGLVEFEIVVPDADAVEAVAARAATVERTGTSVRLQDPDGHGVVIRTAD